MFLTCCYSGTHKSTTGSPTEVVKMMMMMMGLGTHGFTHTLNYNGHVGVCQGIGRSLPGRLLQNVILRYSNPYPPGLSGVGFF
jgi:hypothetical protein